jgi:hypothetical protein
MIASIFHFIFKYILLFNKAKKSDMEDSVNLILKKKLNKQFSNAEPAFMFLLLL